jgi:hypothetical protein
MGFYQLNLGRPTRICIHGHDKDVVGRASQGRCAECVRIRNREKHREERAAAKRDKKPRDELNRLSVPFAPMDAFFKSRQVNMTKLLDPSERRQMFTMRKSNRITVAMADEWAIRCGVHPVEIWGLAWFGETA